MTCQHTPAIYLTRMAAKHPGCWQQVDAMRAMRGNELPDWPSWCFLPLAGAFAILSGGGTNQLSLEEAGEIAAFGALAAWRATQGIYRIHPAVRAAVESTPLEGSIPSEILHRLPEWCVYVETQGLIINSLPVAGFFAYLESDAEAGREELRLVLDCPPTLIGVLPIHLDRGGLELGIAAALAEAERNAHLADQSVVSSLRERLSVSEQARHISPLVNILLYLCAENCEFLDTTDRRKRPELPRATQTKRGPCFFPPPSPTTWEVGMRLGAALESAAAQPTEPAEGTHASPRPHIRRAHWHHFWKGPRDMGQTAILRWLPPIAVNVDDDHPVIPTVRPVDP
jgi:hypothetical protein